MASSDLGSAGKSQRDTMSFQADRNVVKHRARGYQLEMLEESLKGNIIVAVLNNLYTRSYPLTTNVIIIILQNLTESL
jgi:hypothetical protein